MRILVRPRTVPPVLESRAYIARLQHGVLGMVQGSGATPEEAIANLRVEIDTVVAEVQAVDWAQEPKVCTRESFKMYSGGVW